MGGFIEFLLKIFGLPKMEGKKHEERKAYHSEHATIDDVILFNIK